jgi:uncharacterized oligopeptide transporter (OPT) family protein
MGLIEIGQYAGALTAIAILVGMAIKWAIVKPIKAYIDLATYPIHPESNGGRSLSDVAQTVNRIEVKLTEVDERLVAVENHVTKPTRTKKTTT